MSEQTRTKHAEAPRVEVGISYLRVSSKRQMDTAADVDPDGNSINTQRDLCQEKARAMRVMLQREFIEPGTSAQSIEKRPVFRDLLAYLKAHPEVRYVLIYMRSRAFRNYTDAAITKRALSAMGVKLISAKEDFGEGIMADAMEAVTDIMNEVQVRLSGQDIATKMANKARNGGTNSRAKLGYANARIDVDGRKVNTITVDEERAKYVRMAFELWASGQYPNADALQAKLTDVGLRMPGTGQPISTQTIWKLLRDRYYLGYVIYKDMEYPGRHQALISQDLFDKVQVVLDSHSGNGTRQRQHHHFLKGTIWCANCKSRFIVQRAVGRRGGEYFYFLCRGKQEGHCHQPYVPVEVIEEAVEQHYVAHAWLPTELATQLQRAVDRAIASHDGLNDELRTSLTAQLAKGEQKESYLIDLAAEEGWPKDMLRQKIQTIRDERARIQRQLEQTAGQLEAGRSVFVRALELLQDPAAMYEHGNEAVKTILNKAFFGRLYIDGRKVTAHELREPFDMLHDAFLVYQQHRAQPDSKGESGRTYHRRSGSVALSGQPDVQLPGQRNSSTVLLPENGAAGDPHIPAAMREDLVSCLAGSFLGQGWSRDVMVGDEGLEPPTLSV